MEGGGWLARIADDFEAIEGKLDRVRDKILTQSLAITSAEGSEHVSACCACCEACPGRGPEFLAGFNYTALFQAVKVVKPSQTTTFTRVDLL